MQNRNAKFALSAAANAVDRLDRVSALRPDCPATIEALGAALTVAHECAKDLGDRDMEGHYSERIFEMMFR